VPDGADQLIGGDGDDQVSYSRAGMNVRVTLDGLANDGMAGEGDNAQVEDISGGSGDDVLIGNDDSNSIYGDSGDDDIEGRGGDDVLTDMAGLDHLFGGDGDDEFKTDDGDNADELVGGADTDSGVWDAGDSRVSIP
jgi:Ca2+-binding RTX toxin-like protein